MILAWGVCAFLLVLASARSAFYYGNEIDARDLLPRNTSYWADIVAEKIAARDALIPAEYLVPDDLLPDDSVDDVSKFAFESGLFTKRELEITESTASDVVGRVATGEWSATEVLEAVIKRTVVAQQLFRP